IACYFYIHHIIFSALFLLIRPLPRSTLFPYTTLFRSRRRATPVARRTSRSSPKKARRASRRCGTSREKRPPWRAARNRPRSVPRSEEHTSELQSLRHLVCRLLLEKKKKKIAQTRVSAS